MYTRPYDPDHPVVCVDETNHQLLRDGRVGEPTAPGRPARHDYTYEREGTVNFFLLCEPLRGWREVLVTERRTREDFAEVLEHLAEDLYPDVAQITLVMDNLNTHSLGSLYQRFTPDKAKRLADRFAVHYTPKHGSWLNVAEAELSVLNRQCFGARRLGSTEVVRQETTAWTQRRNVEASRVNWQFTTSDARIKLKRLYPVYEPGFGGRTEALQLALPL